MPTPWSNTRPPVVSHLPVFVRHGNVGPTIAGGGKGAAALDKSLAKEIRTATEKPGPLRDPSTSPPSPPMTSSNIASTFVTKASCWWRGWQPWFGAGNKSRPNQRLIRKHLKVIAQLTNAVVGRWHREEQRQHGYEYVERGRNERARP